MIFLVVSRARLECRFSEGTAEAIENYIDDLMSRYSCVSSLRCMISSEFIMTDSALLNKSQTSSLNSVDTFKQRFYRQKIIL